MQRCHKKAALAAVTYCAGLLISAFFHFFRAIGGIRVVHAERFPYKKRNMIVVANHPSWGDGFRIPPLLVSQWVFDPACGPWSTPDSSNFHSKFLWFFWVGAGRIVLVPREDPVGVEQAFLRMLVILFAGGIVIIFPEGGRTSSAKPREKVWTSPKGRKLREIKTRFAKLAIAAHSSILPIWIDRHGWFRWPMFTIKIGHLIHPARDIKRYALARGIEDQMKELADEDG